MGPYRQVPQIGRGPSQFAMEAKPPVPHPMAGQPFQQTGSLSPQLPEQAISEQVHDLAMEIYCRLVSNIAIDRTDREAMRTLALQSQTAARAYFEAMGVQFQS